MFLSRNEVRSLDRRAVEEHGVPTIILMENSGRGAAEVLLSLGVRGPVVICCGKGNNGGDGLVIARHLDLHRIPVRVLLFASPEELTSDAAVNYGIVSNAKIPLEVLAEVNHDAKQLGQQLAAAEWVVDALVGTGLSGPVRSPLDQVIAAINATPARVLAVDLPSGLDADTGQPLGPTVRAEHTVTFVAEKKGFTEPAARPWLGRVHVVGIGAPRCLVESVVASHG